MIIGRHRHVLPVHLIGHAVTERVAEQINVVSAHGIMQNTLRLACAETRAISGEQIGWLFFFTPIGQVFVHTAYKIFRSFHTDNAELAEVV